MKRRLSAILAADVVGYSMLMGEDETETLRALHHFRRELFTPAVYEYRGNLIKSMGDGWLVEFPSARDAVECAIQVQEALDNNNTVRLRIGLHIGDVTFEDEDIYGDGVNIASRLQEIADPGSIVMSDFLRRSIDRKLAAAFNDLGAHELKNISEPVAAYGWRMLAGPNRKQEESLSHVEKPSVAVLPFNIMSGDREQEYLADGVTEDIITELSKFPSIYIIGRSSTFSFKGKTKESSAIGKALQVRFLVEGSIRKMGNRVRVTAKLSQAEKNRQLWAERFDGELDDIFQFLDDVTLRIVNSIDTAITKFELTQINRQKPRNLVAWQLTMQASSLIWQGQQGNQECLRQAEVFLEQAISEDPNYVRALALRSSCNVIRLFYGWNENSKRTFQKALSWAKKAYALDAQDTDALSALCWCLMMSGRAEMARDLVEKLVHIIPRSSEAQCNYGLVLGFCGDGEAALSALALSRKLNPLHPNEYRTLIGEANAYFVLGDYDKAFQAADIGVQMQPGWAGSYWTLAASAALSGNLEKAVEAVDKGRSLVPRARLSSISKHSLFVNPLHVQAFIQGLKHAGLPR